MPSPPQLYSTEAERAAIGAALLNPPLFLNTLNPSEFGTPGFPSLWEWCQDLALKKITPDPITVPAEILPPGQSVQSFISDCPSSVRFDTYANIVRDFAKRRMIISAASLFAQAAIAETDEERIAFMQSATEALKITQSNNGWNVLTLEDAYTPRPPVAYAVGGLIEMPSLNIVFGPPGGLKSMLLADMCVCVAAGMNWLPETLPGASSDLPSADIDPKITTTVPTLWVDFDNGRRRTHERMEALAKSRGLPPDTPFYYISMPSPWLDATKDESVNLLLRHVRDTHAGLVVIDNLGVVSNCDENSADMAIVMSNFRSIAEETGAAIVLVHHQRKTGGGKDARLGETLRGHSSIEASLDLALLVQRNTEKPEEITVVCTKARGVSVPMFGAKFEFTARANSVELAFAHFLGIKITTKAGKTNSTILVTVRESPGINKTDLIASVSVETDSGKNYIRDCIDWLVEHDALRVEAGARNAALYYPV